MAGIVNGINMAGKMEPEFAKMPFVIPIACFIGIAYSIYCYKCVQQVRVKPFKQNSNNEQDKMKQTISLSEQDKDGEEKTEETNKPTPKDEADVESGAIRNVGDVEDAQKVYEIYQLIREGATAFLFAEYKYLAYYIVGFSIIICWAIGFGCKDKIYGFMAAFAFFIGAITSIICGYIGMRCATYSNARTAIKAKSSLAEAFHIAFSGGSVMGFSLVSLGLIVLFAVFISFIYLVLPNQIPTKAYPLDEEEEDYVAKYRTFCETLQNCMRALAGFGIGASSVALFARVGGGIYTKAADVGADLVGKVEAGIPEDDPRNPATIADNVGDNVGDIAGMGADLFGSFAGSTCASFVLGAHLHPIINEDQDGYQQTVYDVVSGNFKYTPLLFGLTVSAAGIIGCFISALLFNSCVKIETKKDVKSFLSRHEGLSTIIASIFVILFSIGCFGYDDYEFKAGTGTKTINWKITSLCVICGLIGGWIIGEITEYYTSTEYNPVKEVAASCKTGAATNIIYGLALGYMSTGIPVIVLAFDIWLSMYFGGMYGVSLATLGVLTTLCTALSVDAFGPIADNAGGIAEMAEFGEDVRDRTDALDATGNTTAAIGKGFAIGSAGCVGVALMGAFQFTVSKNEYYSIIDEMAFAGLLIGSMLPYIFSALTMKAVGKAALEMVEEVRRQFRENPGIMDGSVKPDCDRCIMISTEASLKEMIIPGLLVIITPLFFGFIFGTRMVVGILAGSLVSGVQCALSASNTGGAWDNAKKYIEAGLLSGCNGKGSNEHKAAVIGDTVGDPLKDTSGPALNILIKLMGIISVVFAKAMMVAQEGQQPNNHSGIFNLLPSFNRAAAEI